MEKPKVKAFTISKFKHIDEQVKRAEKMIIALDINPDDIYFTLDNGLNYTIIYRERGKP